MSKKANAHTLVTAKVINNENSLKRLQESRKRKIRSSESIAALIIFGLSISALSEPNAFPERGIEAEDAIYSLIFLFCFY
jgi:hypothetical protein